MQDPVKQSEPAPSAHPAQNTAPQEGDLRATSAIVVVFAASIIEFIAASRTCDKLPKDSCKKEYAFAVAVGVASAFFAFAFLLYMRFVPRINTVVIKILAFLLAGLWVGGAGVLTFRKPFVETGNGYFSSWLAFGAASYFLHHNVGAVQSAVHRVYARGASATVDVQALWIMLTASVIELTAAAVLCDNSLCNRNNKWAVALGAISTLLSIISLILGEKLGIVKAVFAIILLGMWIFGAGVLTFDEPFSGTGNGYFSCWVAFFASVVWAYYVLGEKIPALKRRT